MEDAVKILNVTFALLLTLSPGFAQSAASPSASRPTDESVRELLKVTEAKKLVEALPQQIDTMMTAAVQQRLQGQAVTAQQQQSIDVMRAKVAALIKEDLDWNVLEPTYIKLYADSFSQSEIDGLIAFYKTPVGHAVVQKLPLVMQGVMSMTQQRMARLVPRIQQMAQETAAQIKAQDAAAAADRPN
jgi:uncharacterized protein